MPRCEFGDVDVIDFDTGENFGLVEQFNGNLYYEPINIVVEYYEGRLFDMTKSTRMFVFSSTNVVKR